MAVFKNPLALIGLGLVFCSLVGLVLAVGNLVSLQYTPDKMVERLREPYVEILTEAGAPPEIVRHIENGDVIPEALRSELSAEPAEALELVETHLPRLIDMVSQAAQNSRGKSRIGIGVCILVTIIGGIIAAIGFRRSKKPGDAPAGMP